VAQICRRLDGIPLAIELAAARIKILSVDEIAVRLDDRFSLLTAGSRTAVPRHQTLRATIDWSYDLLTEPERILLRRLSVFAGGFALEAAEEVCSRGMKRSDILDLLGRLVDKSLVIVEANVEISETRYRLLETIRQYALEKLIELGEAPAIRDQHLGYYLTLAEKSEPNMFGGESEIWFRRLDKELDNIRAATEWSTNTGKAHMALRIAGALDYFWFSHGLSASEWHEWVQQALARPEGKERTLARARALNGIGFMYFADIVPMDRRPELEEALSIAREFGDQWNTATALRNLGLMENVKGNYLESRTLLEQSLAIWREMGLDGQIGRAWTLIFLGDVALNRDQSDLARSLYEEVVTILRETGDVNFLAYSVRRLGQLMWREGEYDKAIALCTESLNLNRQIDSPRGVIACLAAFAAIAMAQGKYQWAAQLMAAVETQMVSRGITLLYMDQQEYQRNLAHLRAKLNEKLFNKFWAKGKGMSLDEAVALALDER
jgi:non-specific serine/threonine protein kinase